MSAGKVLLISTSYRGKLGEALTGSWAEEVATPCFTWRERGFTVDLFSITGGEIFFDPNSTSGDFCTPEAKSFLEGEETATLYKSTKSIADLSDADLETYDAVFIAGGHGIMFDGPDSSALKHILEFFTSKGKIVSAVCHGPCGLLADAPLLKGKRVTGFTNSEEKAVGKENDVPYSLEDRLKESGAEFELGPDWGSHVVVDGKLITGQNPQSSLAVAEAVSDAILPGIAPQHGKGPNEGFHRRDHPVTHEHHEHGDDKTPEHPQVRIHT